MFDQLEDQTRKNMKMFSQALAMFNPFAAPGRDRPPRPKLGTPGATGTDDLETIKRDMSEMQKRLDRLSNKG